MPAALIALSLIPVLAGSLRLVQLSGGPEAVPAQARFDASPAPVVTHVASAIVYSLLGAFQFSAGLRRRRPGWHRTAGRVLVATGLATALSAVWMTLFSPGPNGSSELLFAFRLLAGIGMAVSIVVGFTAIRRREVARHRAWMTRAYALGLGAATQAFTLGVGEAIVGTAETSHALLMGAGWAINLAFAELIIRKRPGRGPGRVVAGGSHG